MQGDEVIHIIAAAVSNHTQNVWRHRSFVINTVLWRVSRKWCQLLLCHLCKAEFVCVLMICGIQNTLSLSISRSKLFIVDREWGLTGYLLDIGSDRLPFIRLMIGSGKSTSQSRAHVFVSMASHIFQDRCESGPINRLARLPTSLSFSLVHLMAGSGDFP